LEEILQEIRKLIVIDNPQIRGKRFEEVMNRLFAVSGILIRESFGLVKESGHGISEEIDGVIELDGHIYLVEMKWLKDPVDVVAVSRHINRVLTRGECRGLFISYSGYTGPAIDACKEIMKLAPIVLCTLKEFVLLIEKEKTVEELLRAKIRSLIIDKQPLAEVL
jgi:predicted RecB family endonuclease